MYLAMNRFSVNVEREAEWEAIWKNRETYLQEVPGFVQFMLLRGAEPGDYISYSVWEDQAAFTPGPSPRPSAKATPREQLPEYSQAHRNSVSTNR